MRSIPRLLPLFLAACGSRLATHPAPEHGFDPGRARAEVAWLADPARTGRGIGTPGGPAAAAWIADRFAEAGLQPAFDGSYLQSFDAPYRATLGERNALSVGEAPAALAKDFLPFGFSDDGAVEGELVFVGHGITAPDLGYDDYAGLDVKGKIVLLAQDFPREGDAASPFREPATLPLRRVALQGDQRPRARRPRGRRRPGRLGTPGRRRPAALARPGLLARRARRGPSDDGRAPARRASTSRALAAPGEADGRPHPRPLGVRARLAVEVRHERAATANVVAVLPGRDPALAGECVVVGAHHDHLGLGGDASLAPEQLGTVHPGADDNASGVAALLAVARALAAEGPARRTLLFAAFGAEELGVLGSAELVKSPPVALRGRSRCSSW